MEASKASARYQRIQPRKLRIALDMIRGLRVNESLDIMSQAHTKGAKIVLKVLHAAIANAVDKGESMKVEPDHLFVQNAWVDGGPVTKRFRPRAMGRATRILKRTSHLTIVLGMDESEAEEA
ncbi:MAG: 50S ribosomal protein L22 [Gemmatimonadetes bacterium]|nr:50S ribosomal protein L22 [Gemmatimonadota bacterium]